MRKCCVLGLLVVALLGCVRVRPLTEPMGPPVPLYSDNPLLLPVRDWSVLWEALTNVIDDYFRIESEIPVRMVGDTLTEGRIDTFPETGSTVLEPWRHDSADPYEKVESTLQSIRRQAHVRVIPADRGFVVDVTVYKELEDVKHPAHVSAGAATFRTESSLTRVVNPIGEQEVNQGWIRLGRDRALEQRILAHLQEALGVQGVAPMPREVPVSQPSGPSCQPTPSQGAPGCSNPARCASEQQKLSGATTPRAEDQFALAAGVVGYDGFLAHERSVRNWTTPEEQSPFWFDTTETRRPWEPTAAPDADAFTPEIFTPEISQSFDQYQAPAEDWQPFRAAKPDFAVWWARCGDEAYQLLYFSIQDYGHFYSASRLVALSGGIGLAAVLANVKTDDNTIDENFQQWYENHVSTRSVKKFARAVGEFGNGRYFLPVYGICIGLADRWPENPTIRWFGEWGERSLRSFIVGAPVILALQYGLGANRPEEQTNGSRWAPFHGDNSASGHTFIGGINFLNAAILVENVPLKSALYVASVVPGWTRIALNKHYLSQVVLGWCVAYLSVSAVDWTERQQTAWQITPLLNDQELAIQFARAW